MKVTMIAAAALCTVLLTASASAQTKEAQKQVKNSAVTTQQAADVYVCPMHPDVSATAAGKCSKCGMALEKQAKREETVQTTGQKKEMKKKGDGRGCCEAGCGEK